MENINLDVLPTESERMMEELAAGNMVIARSKRDFLYIIEYDGGFEMFSHTIGDPGGGRKEFPKDEKNTAVISKIAELSDAVYKVEFEKNLDLLGVMYTAEEAILAMFPGDYGDDEMVDFGPPPGENSE